MLTIKKLKPWYHDFSSLGVDTKFPSYRPFPFLYKKDGISHHSKQQNRKEKIILPMISKAIKEFKKKEAIILDLFCSDGYYGFHSIKNSLTRSLIGIDFEQKSINQSIAMSKYLKINKQCTFVKADVRQYIKKIPRCDILLNLGGMYHLEDPKGFLLDLLSLPWTYQIISTAITIDTEDPNYFVTPHPKWTWGSWYTYEWIRNTLIELGYEIIDEERDARAGSNKGCVGGAYFLVKKRA